LKALLLIITLITFIWLSCLSYGCIPNKPPIAAFTYSPANPRVCESIFFNASASYDPDGSIASYTWDFDDGNITKVFNAIVSHHYEISGTYNVTLTVEDSGGLKNSTSREITVTAPPLASFSYSPTLPQVGETVIFNASQSKPDGGYIVSYEWDFGDANITAIAEPVITHFYSTFGVYTVTLTVIDSENESDTTSENIRVWAYPHADFTHNPPVPRVYENVEFDASHSTPDGGYIVSYEWNFGDATSGSGMTVTHQYAEAGNYTVTLNVTDSEGKCDMKSKNIEVLPKREDLNEDGKVDILDLAVLCKAYGSYPEHPRWNPKADIVPDLIINILDVVKVAKAFYQ
jgi:PKD repeat protein